MNLKNFGPLVQSSKGISQTIRAVQSFLCGSNNWSPNYEIEGGAPKVPQLDTLGD